MSATARTQSLVDEAKASSRRVIGREDPEFIYEYLARQILGADACISIGYIRAGRPSERPPKPDYVPVDNFGTRKTDG